ncbi:hypothetical protein [Archangium lansingense]|uniref:Uncharacterized protein n=1 Tax=Archangium lansingense TaxID=2995310 RepID=A0ABT3ZU83_9BACT|nr:hypothetical protein [Archangium lansinium]MCY1072968.1 hypothetical protein [Archangium lansinium]
MRKLYEDINQAVLGCYGWSDLAKERHGFIETPLGVCFTLKSENIDKMLDRLLERNQQSYAEEVKQGIPDTPIKGKKPNGKGDPQPHPSARDQEAEWGNEILNQGPLLSSDGAPALHSGRHLPGTRHLNSSCEGRTLFPSWSRHA